MTIRGTATPVIDGVVTKATGAANFAMSSNGVLLYESGDAADGERTLVWVDRKGREEPILGAPKRAYAYPRISPDGTRIALDIRGQENDISLWDVTRQNLTRLTFDPGLNRGIVWMPDGKTLVFSAQRSGTESLFSQAADGSGSPEQLTNAEAGRAQVPYSISADGTRLVFGEPGSQPFDLYTLQLGAERKVTPLLNVSSYNEHNGEVSPDGRWLAYQSDESKSNEIYVRPFPECHRQPCADFHRWRHAPRLGAKRSCVSPSSRTGRWSRYRFIETRLAAFRPVRPRPFSRAVSPDAGGAYYHVSPDGSRFLMIKSAAPNNSPPPQLWVVLNWFEELKRLVPTK